MTFSVHLDESAVPDYSKLISLAERVIIVAGAGQGIGRQTVHALASAGARVVCVDTIPERANAVAREVDGLAVVADVTQRTEVERILALAISAYGRLDGIVDIVGMSRFQYISQMSDEDWDWAQNINLKHAFLLAQLGGAALAEHGGGSIVFTASVSGMTGAQRHAHYGAAKAGLIGLVKSAAVEFGPSQVRVNAVAPGVIWTERIGGAIGEDRRADWTSQTPMGRLGVPEDIAAAMLFLSSDLSGFVTGQTLVVDGGLQVRFNYPVDNL